MKSVPSSILCFVIFCSSLWKVEGLHIRRSHKLLNRDEEAMARRFWRCCNHHEPDAPSWVCSENSCYFILDGQMTWREARRQCQDSYGYSDIALYDVVPQKHIFETIAANASNHSHQRWHVDRKVWIGYMKPGVLEAKSAGYNDRSGPWPFYGWMQFLKEGLKYGFAGQRDRAPGTACNFTIPVDLYRRCFIDGYKFACQDGGINTCSSAKWNGRSLASSPIGAVQKVICSGGRFEEYYQCYPNNTWKRLNGSCYEDWAADILEDLKNNSSDALLLASDMYDYVATTRATFEKRETYGQGPKDVPFSLGKVIDVVHSIVDLGYTQAANYSTDETFNFTQHVISTLSVIVDSDQNWEWQDVAKGEQASLASKVIAETERTGQLLACTQAESSMNTSGGKITVHGENIDLQAFILTEADTVVCFPSCDSSESSSIKIYGDLPLESLPESCTERAHVGIATAYRNLGNRLLRRENHYSEKISAGERIEYDTRNSVINSEVVGFFVGALNTSIQFEGKVVEVTLQHINTTTKPSSCVFWNFSKLGGAGQWDSSGCEVDVAASGPQQTKCRCDHLTNFAILVDMTGEVEDTPVMTVLTIVCCVLSIVCLVITIGCLSCVRALRCRRSVIACNVSFCLIVSNFIILTALKRTQATGIQCLVTRSILLYALLAAFMWMLLEGFHLYRMLVVVFNHNSIPVLWFYVFGYGLPVTITTAAACLTRNRFRDNFCWFASEDIFYFCGPMIAVIVINVIVLVVALSAASSVKVKKRLRTSERITTWLKGSASLVFLLGITWVLGLPLLAGRAVPYMEYIFTVVNGSQGVTMFIFHVACNEKSRTAVLKALRGHAFAGAVAKTGKMRAKKRGFKSSLSFGSQTSTSSTQLNSISASLNNTGNAGRFFARDSR